MQKIAQNPNKKPFLIAIVGPTATGKSDLAVAIAQKFNGQIISADSRQVYKGLDIGSGKITKKEMLGIKHHLLDMVSAKTIYSASKFKKSAEQAITKILENGKLPIVVGGTGFWIDALTKNQNFPEVKPNLELRKTLSTWSTQKLFKQLQKLDPERAKIIDAKNPVRLIRAIEIAKDNKKQGLKTSSTEILKEPAQQNYKVLYIGLDGKDADLKEKISKRLKSRLENGMIEEVQKLHKNKVSWQRLYDLGLEYRFVSEFLQDNLTYEQMQKDLELAIWHFAKRQRTWFKRNKEINWLDCQNKKQTLQKSSQLVQNFLKKS